MADSANTFSEAIVALMLRLREIGIAESGFLKVIESVPHELFVPPQFFTEAWKPQILPLDCGQTMPRIDTTLRLVSALNLNPEHSVLEIGTGSGYQTALLARMSRHVNSVERYKSLRDAAAKRLQTLQLANTSLIVADGSDGLTGHGLYDRIICDLAHETMPRHLLEQLVSGGIVITAIGDPHEEQMAVRLTKIGSRFDREDLFPVRFGPFESGVARAT